MANESSAAGVSAPFANVFRNKLALVTGAASGIGAATAHALSENGATVCVVDLPSRAAEGKRVAAECGGTFLGADVTSIEDWESVAASVGAVDYVHLNAGVVGGVGLFDLPLEAYQRMFRVNVDGVVNGLWALVPHMKAGAIVATASLAGVGPYAGDPVYAATKHAVVGLVRSMVDELGRRNITFNCVCPGMTLTGLVPAPLRKDLEDQGFTLMAPARVASAVLTALASGRSGEAWVVESGREIAPYNFRGVPGPRL